MLRHRWLPTALALAVAFPLTSMAQERGRQGDAERKQQLEEAQSRVEAAQKALQHALQELQATRSDQANDAMREAMEALRDAQRSLRTDEVYGLLSRTWTATPRPLGGAVIAFTSRPKMGVVLAPASDDDTLGVKLQAVSPGAPADEAGLKAGDVILEANGVTLARNSRRQPSPSSQLTDLLGKLDEGDTVTVKYQRGNETHTAKVVLRDLGPGAYSFVTSGDSNFSVFVSPRVAVRGRIDSALRSDIGAHFDPRDYSGVVGNGVFAARLPYSWLDMELTDLNPDLGEYFGTSKGILVVRGPRSEDLGLKSGDVILSIDGREPTSPSHALRIMRSYDPGETMNIEIMRNKHRQTITVKVPERDRGFLWEPGPSPDRQR